MKEFQLGIGIDNHEPVGLGHLRGNFCQMLGARYTDRDGKAELRPHALADCAGNFSRRTEQMGAARNVAKGLVDRNPLDQRREVADHLDGGIAQPLVILEMAADKSELRTELARLPSRHAAADPKGLGFVGSGKHNPATDGDGLAAQRRVEQLLDRGIKGIQVCMEDGGCRCHPDRSPVTFHRSPDENIMRTCKGECQAGFRGGDNQTQS